MSAMPPFDVLTCQLTGINLVEASAGTGKTWNICALYLRLLLERRLKVNEILVVTFTKAATAELRERIRNRLVDALACAESADGQGPDKLVAQLVEQARRSATEPGDALHKRLREAVECFDEAAIHTIHGYCQRALGDAAFSAAQPFTVEVVTDGTDLLRETVNDFWRRRVASPACPPDLAAWLLATGTTPDRLAGLLQRRMAKPVARLVWPEGDAQPGDGEMAALGTAYDQARRAWQEHRDDIVGMVMEALPRLNGRQYSADLVARSATAWDQWLAAGTPMADPPKDLPRLTRERLRSGTKGKGSVPPAHPFFDAAQAVIDQRASAARRLERARLALVRDLFEREEPALRRAKRERRLIGYDDMLFNLRDALAGASGAHLAESLRRQYPAALIDEFQDTDPLQFAIFSRLYGDGRSPLFFVGDPKQAIYSFRNADLHTYLRARDGATAVCTIARNQRSTPAMVAAFNALFAANPRAFMLDGLEFPAAEPGDRERPPFADESDADRAALRFWMLPSGSDSPVLGRRQAIEAAARATAAEAARLIAAGREGRIRIGAEKLGAGNIAVLVRTHVQGTLVKRELAALGVGSVELSQESVFASVDALEIERLLVSIDQPSRDDLLRGALATEMMGFDAATIEALAADEAALGERLQQFADYRDTWARRGIGVMFRQLLAREDVGARMLARPDGERRLTNLLHLGERLHEASQMHDSPEALLRWLAAQRADPSADEAAQLRLESDRNLVKIVTVHKAKGLEFDVVFCPFLWVGESGRSSGDASEYHDEAGDAVLDFRPADDIAEAEREDLATRIRLESAAESLRLVYVAITRAVYRCYLAVGHFAARQGGSPGKPSRASPLNWLAAGKGREAPDWLSEGGDAGKILDAWRDLAATHAPQVSIVPLPEAPGCPLPREAPPAGSLSALPPPRIPRGWQVGSFSSLAGQATRGETASDRDERVGQGPASEMPANADSDDILRFPRGSEAGKCLHAVFEYIDFTSPGTWEPGIARALAAHPQARGQRTPDRATLARMALRMTRDVLSTPLTGSLRLDGIGRQRRLSELAFSIPAHGLAAEELNAALAAEGYDVPPLAFRDLDGYLNGVIDLMFEHDGRYWILDWKSNHLGNSAADYGPRAVGEAMDANGYHLQHLLYTLALHRYLGQRLPGYHYPAHVGGVLYLFVRGVRPDWKNGDGTPAGVYRHLPSPACIARLDTLFCAGKGAS